MKQLSLTLLSLFSISIKAQFVTISGEMNPCPDGSYESYSATFVPAGSGSCGSSDDKTYHFTAVNGSIIGNNGTSSPNVTVVWSTQPCPTSGSLRVDVKDIANSICATYNLPINIKGYWNAVISGPTNIYGTGVYNYAVNPPACGATNYSWSFPSGWQCANGLCNTSAVQYQTAGNPLPQSGQISISSNAPNVCGTPNAEVTVEENCYNNGVPGEYDPQKVENRIVTGDFDNDGKEDDLMAFYDFTNNIAAMHVWLSDGTKFNYQGDNGWWYGTSFDANRVMDVVAGDFDNDGYKDDIAATYDWFNTFRIYIWTSNGSSFTALNQWVSTSSYVPSRTTNRVVAGDFDHDGHIDDIVIFYENPTGGNCNMLLWKSNGSSFSGPFIALSNLNFDATKLTGRVVAGDFDSDGWYDDIAGFYDYLGTYLYVWTWNSSGFNQKVSWFWAPYYNEDMITGKIVSGDFDKDGKHDDITAFYYYGNWQTRAHVYLGNTTNFTYQGDNGWWSSTSYDDQNNNRIKYRVVSGEFGQTGLYRGPHYYDIAAFYDYPCYSAGLHVWKSTATSLNFQGNLGWWKVCDECEEGRFAMFTEQNSTESKNADINSTSLVKIMPNPNNGLCILESENEMHNTTLEVRNVLGQVVMGKQFPVLSKELIDISHLDNGIYFIHLTSSENTGEIHKIIKQ